MDDCGIGTRGNPPEAWGAMAMTNPYDPITARKRNPSELMALMQQSSLYQQENAQAMSGGSLPSSLEDELIGGLTKREYFAAMAFKACVDAYGDPTSADVAAKDAVKMADALIDRLNKEVSQ
jgi:hypothetical protein